MTSERTQQIVDAVADATRSGLGQVAPAELDRGWQRLEGALSEGKFPSVPIVATASRWWLPGFALAAAALVIGFAIHRYASTRPAVPLHYVVEGAAPAPGETIVAAPSAPARLLFSDRSQISARPSTRMSVLTVDARGARVALADGALDVAVQHRQDASWRFEAGPFSVAVRGTAFHLAFEASRGRLAVQMLTGVVEVRGAADGRVFTLRAGESLELFAAPARQPEPAVPVPAPLPASTTDAVAPFAPPAPRVALAPARRRTAHVEPAQPESANWSRLIARGEFAAVVRDAERRGLDATLAGASADELTALADAARYTRRNELARQALLGVRARFPSSARASEAAFFLGRLAELSPASAPAALSWYEAYLGESAGGPYAGEALGRELVLLARSDPGRARKTAQTYLERFPRGAQAHLAKSLLESAPE
jgi:hypothetical protein